MTLPAGVAALSFVAGAGMVIAGVYQLAGPGWALICGAVPCLALSIIIGRGLK